MKSSIGDFCIMLGLHRITLESNERKRANEREKKPITQEGTAGTFMYLSLTTGSERKTPSENLSQSWYLLRSMV